MKRPTARGPKPRRTVARPRTESTNAGCIRLEREFRDDQRRNQ